MATVDGQLCRSHALALQLELDSPASRIIDGLDRALSGRGGDPVAQVFGQALGQALGMLAHKLRPRPQDRPGPSPAPRPAPPPPAPPRPPGPDPRLLEARLVLGFEAGEPLTEALIKERKRALARVFHPDAAGGAGAHMRRVNAAADLLMSKL